MKTGIRVWSYLAQFVLEWKRLDKVVEKIEANIFGSITVFRKSCHL
jgi:hypothetical protein